MPRLIKKMAALRIMAPIPRGDSQPDEVARSPIAASGTIILPPFRMPKAPYFAAFYHMLIALAIA